MTANQAWYRNSDRWLAAAGLLLVSALAWIYTLAGAGMGMSAFDMTAMTPAPGQAGMAMPLPLWTTGYALLMLVMWWIMMVAMMLPSAMPMILLFARVNSGNKKNRASLTPTWIFTSGYLIAWGFFSVAAVAAQWWMSDNKLISPMLSANSPLVAGTIMIAAGLYQLTPLKHACLAQCRAPMQFIAGHWRAGRVGALRMGIDHGLVCLGCCWALMALLFVGGVMNLYWIAAIAVFVLLEKAVAGGHWLGRLTGVVLIIWGLMLLLEKI